MIVWAEYECRHIIEVEKKSGEIKGDFNKREGICPNCIANARWNRGIDDPEEQILKHIQQVGDAYGCFL